MENTKTPMFTYIETYSNPETAVRGQIATSVENGSKFYVLSKEKRTYDKSTGRQYIDTKAVWLKSEDLNGLMSGFKNASK